MTEKPQVLEVDENYKMLVATSAALIYLYMDDDKEAESKNATLESLMDNMNVMDSNNESFYIGIQ
jgi:hypothetical protein